MKRSLRLGGTLAALLAVVSSPLWAAPSTAEATVPPLPLGQFEQVTLAMGSEDAGEPIGLAVLPNGDALHTSRDGRVFYTTKTGDTSVAARVPVYTHDEDGMQAVAVDPNFETNRWVYLYYAPRLDTPADDPATPGINEGDAPTDGTEADFEPYQSWQYLSRFKLEGTTIDLASEQVILQVPSDRGLCCHVGGDIAFDADNNLFLSTGDDTNPFSSDNYTPIDERPTRNPSYDAQRTASNTNDLRGKVLRIHAQADGSYTIPEGNLFGPGGTYTGVDSAKARPEIYAMGFRNPFRMGVDPRTGWLYLGEYGPDAAAADGNRGPEGIVEFNQIRTAGNYGWPYCSGPNKPYVDYNFATGESGATFDCQAPVNESPRNTGLRELPPAQEPWIWYDGGTVHYNGNATDEFGTGGEAPMGGPVYDYNPELDSDVKFPESLDGDVFVGDWARGWIKTVDVGSEGEPTAISPFFDTATIAAPMDMQFGPDGSLYVLDYGSGSYTGAAPDSALYKINSVSGSRAPVATVSATPDNGPAPLTVSLSSAGSMDPDGEPLSYAWDFDGNGTTDSTEANPTHVYQENGDQQARLTVTDLSGKTATATRTVTVGNTRPTVTLEYPATGLVYDGGDRIQYKVTVTDPEDGPVDCARVVVQTALGHNEHAHGDQSTTGCEGTVVAPQAWEAENQLIFYVLNVSYTDGGGVGASSPLTASAEAVLQTRVRQAEHFTNSSGVTVGDVTDSAGGGGRAIAQTEHGDYASYGPLNLAGITALDLRVAAGPFGGTVQARLDSATGPVVGSASVTGTGTNQPWSTVRMPVSDPGGSHELFLVFDNTLVPQNPLLPGNIMSVNFLQFVGRGVNSAPTMTAAADPASGSAPLATRFTAAGADADGDTLAYAWDFGVQGTTSDTSTAKDPGYTYTAPGTYNATVTVSDGHGGIATATVQVVVEQAADTTAPKVTDPTPADGSTTTNRQPTISATARDDRSQLGTGDLVLYIDGVQTGEFTYDPSTGRLSHVPSKRLSFGEHTVRVLATDRTGNSSTLSWSFVVQR
ncbi:cytochrome c [Arthrobacter sp. V4I6]|uniref:PQQ-dependent sugar dehydrogenase n=1 Tax=unclassified Arthrobacter TaxID=235627 RepID=UPI002781E6A2|nr:MULTISPECIES: PQQ-dependent sugar dehydrogenase [unclassified Arthrobacter]MDQ0822881.1 cytochrome c [Arthrobacter sp. V1I7]MDQ0852510.1 cytochrome c [Arthrobacter sp. V4I6]